MREIARTDVFKLDSSRTLGAERISITRVLVWISGTGNGNAGRRNVEKQGSE